MQNQFSPEVRRTDHLATLLIGRGSLQRRYKLREILRISCQKMSNSSVCNILDIPDEILVKIILHLGATERLALGRSCQRFNDLVFGDGTLLRNLNFTSEGDLTKESDIQQYFNNEKTYMKIFCINTERVRAVSGIRSSIGKAINLVELNILGALEFKHVEEVSHFLKPLVNLKRLSLSWPDSSIGKIDDVYKWKLVLKERLNRLTYLSLEIECYSDKLLPIFQLCKQLEELRLSISRATSYDINPLFKIFSKLSNLKSVRFPGWKNLGVVPADCTNYRLVGSDGGIYLESDVEVCEELSQVKEMPPPKYFEQLHDLAYNYNGWTLVFKHLISEVIKITREDAPAEFCCLSEAEYSVCRGQPCLLTFDETKKLLKDPEYQISFLHVQHEIEKKCDVHLLASAFPNLTTLVLRGMSNRNPPEKTAPLYRRLRRKGSLAFEEDDIARNTDSSFKMLIENTPGLKVLDIGQTFGEDKVQDWDFDAFNLISGWKNLVVIRLYDVPIKDGKFLIDIGRECEKLEVVKLHRLGLNKNCSWESELLQMLKHCKNLRELAISRTSLEQFSEMLDTLSNCSELIALHLGTIITECDFLVLETSVEKMIRQCPKLIRFSLDIHHYRFLHGLRWRVKRIISDFNRLNLQFCVGGPP